MSNETKPLLSYEQYTALIESVWIEQGWGDSADPDDRTPFGAEGTLLVAGMDAVRDLYEADRSKLMAVLQVCADAMYLVQNRRGPFHRDIEAERALSQLKSIGVEPNK